MILACPEIPVAKSWPYHQLKSEGGLSNDLCATKKDQR